MKRLILYLTTILVISCTSTYEIKSTYSDNETNSLDKNISKGYFYDGIVITKGSKLQETDITREIKQDEIYIHTQSGPNYDYYFPLYSRSHAIAFSKSDSKTLVALPRGLGFIYYHLAEPISFNKVRVADTNMKAN